MSGPCNVAKNETSIFSIWVKTIPFQATKNGLTVGQIKEN